MIQKENNYEGRIITNAQSPITHECNKITTWTVQNIAIFVWTSLDCVLVKIDCTWLSNVTTIYELVKLIGLHKKCPLLHNSENL